MEKYAMKRGRGDRGTRGGDGSGGGECGRGFCGRVAALYGKPAEAH
jgi:hypothetical protein